MVLLLPMHCLLQLLLHVLCLLCLRLRYNHPVCLLQSQLLLFRLLSDHSVSLCCWMYNRLCLSRFPAQSDQHSLFLLFHGKSQCFCFLDIFKYQFILLISSVISMCKCNFFEVFTIFGHCDGYAFRCGYERITEEPCIDACQFVNFIPCKRNNR